MKAMCRWMNKYWQYVVGLRIGKVHVIVGVWTKYNRINIKKYKRKRQDIILINRLHENMWRKKTRL